MPISNCIFYCFVVFILGMFTGGSIDKAFMHTKVIKYGCGQYNSNTGHFEWKHNTN